jgi:hypothetical protein
MLAAVAAAHLPLSARAALAAAETGLCKDRVRQLRGPQILAAVAVVDTQTRALLAARES